MTAYETPEDFLARVGEFVSRPNRRGSQSPGKSAKKLNGGSHRLAAGRFPEKSRKHASSLA